MDKKGVKYLTADLKSESYLLQHTKYSNLLSFHTRIKYKYAKTMTIQDQSWFVSLIFHIHAMLLTLEIPFEMSVCDIS